MAPDRPAPGVSGYLRTGAIAGLAGGASLAATLRLLDGPLAEAIEREHTASGHAAGEELFTRGVQQAGGAIGSILYGLAVGLIFGVVFAATRHRLVGPDHRRAWRLAGLGFVTVFLVTWLKYPPNPPGVGDPDTVGSRTALYLALLWFSVLSAWLAFQLRERLLQRSVPEQVAAPAAFAAFIALVGLAFAVLPGGPDAGDAADLVWRFRLSSLAGGAALWAVLGTAYGWLLGRTAPHVAERADITP